MSVIQMTPCVLTADWAGFVAWCATTFDMPVACQFDTQGWGRLAATSKGVTVIDRAHFADSIGDDTVVVELQVNGLQRHFDRALAAGAEAITAPKDVTETITHAAVMTPQGVRLWLLAETPVPSTASGAAASDPNTVNPGPINFTVDKVIEAPAADVFRAVTSKDALEQFFVSRVSKDMDGVGPVTWEFGGIMTSQLDVVSFQPNAFVAFHWPAHGPDYRTRTQFAVTPQGPHQARLAITESGWNADAEGLKTAFGNCEGWTTFVINLKAFLET